MERDSSYAKRKEVKTLNHKKLDDGLDRERMVKFCITAMKLVGEDIPKNDLVFMLTQQYPEAMAWNHNLIVQDAYHLISKMRIRSVIEKANRGIK